MENDLSIEEMIQIGTQLFPEYDPQEIAEFIDDMKSEVPGISNSDILNMVIHMVVDKKGQIAPQMDGLRQLMKKR